MGTGRYNCLPQSRRQACSTKAAPRSLSQNYLDIGVFEY